MAQDQALTVIDISIMRNDFSLNGRAPDDLRLRRRRRGAWTGRWSPLAFPLDNPEPTPLNLRRRWRPRRRRPFPLNNSRARAFHDRRWAERTVRSLDNSCPETHSVHGWSPAGAPHPLPGVIDNPRTDLFPFTDLWRRRRRGSRAHAPRPCLGDDALSHNGRGGSWPRPCSLNRLDVTLAQDQGPCFGWSTGFVAHEMGHPRLAVYYLFPDSDLHIAAPGHGRRRGTRPSLLPTLVVDLFIAGRRRSPHGGRASWRVILVIDVPLLVAAEGLRHGGCCSGRRSGAWLQTGDRHRLGGFGWRAETWGPSLGKRSVPCRLRMEVVAGRET